MAGMILSAARMHARQRQQGNQNDPVEAGRSSSMRVVHERPVRTIHALSS
jgi:hypothetical protein